jgi:DNA-binding MarR family transcriptional regulator
VTCTDPEAAETTPRDLRQAFHKVVRRFGLLDGARTPCGQPLAVSHAHALMELLRTSGQRQLDLAHSLGLSKSAVSRLVDQLEKRGWLERQADEEDGRAWRLKLSPQGRQAARRLDEASLARFAGILNRIPQEARGQIVSSLALLQEAIPNEMDEERTMRSTQDAETAA